MIRNHMRSNIVGYVALFVALSGTAVALPATNTVFSDDIVNGEVRSKDISDTNGVRSADVRDDDRSGGGLAAIDLDRNSAGRSEIATDGVASPEIALDAVRQPEIAADSVGSPEIKPDGVRQSEIAADGVGSPEIKPDGVRQSEIAADGVGSPEIKPDAVRGSEIAANGVGSAEIATDAVRGLEIATGGVGSLEIAQNAVGASELGFGSVGKDAIADGGVGANELDEVYERETLGVEVEDGTAHDGAYGIGNARVACGGSDDDLLSVSIDWTDANGHNERFLADVEIDRVTTADAAVVRGAFDGGGGTADPARFIAVATCLR